MLKKNYSKTGRLCRVTFDLPAEVNAARASLCGDFNEWSSTANAMKLRKDGRLSITLSLTVGQIYRFKYWLDDHRWENDHAADGYAPNDFGTEDSVVKV